MEYIYIYIYERENKRNISRGNIEVHKIQRWDVGFFRV